MALVSPSFQSIMSLSSPITTQLLSQYDIILGFIVGVLPLLGTNGALFITLDAITSFGVSVA